MSNCFQVESFGPGGAIFPPNKPLDPRIEFSRSPVVYDTLFFLDFNESGNCIVGASEVAGTFWEGTLLYFKNDKYMENFDYTGHYIYTTTSDGKFVRKNIIALAEDTGNINILSLDEDSTIRAINYFKVIERIPQIAVWENSSRILCCSERSVIIWDADSIDRKPCDKFDNYHLEKVTSVDTLKKDTNRFISGGKDRMCCIWDIRAPVPSSDLLAENVVEYSKKEKRIYERMPQLTFNQYIVELFCKSETCSKTSDKEEFLYINEFSTISAVSWNQVNDNYIVAGTQAGDIYLLDKREPMDFISVYHCFDVNVNRISFNNSNEFAVCGDINEVLILNSKKDSLERIYKNAEHTGPVKDLKWHAGSLYSCGFGKCLVKHVRTSHT